MYATFSWISIFYWQRQSPFDREQTRMFSRAHRKTERCFSIALFVGKMDSSLNYHTFENCREPQEKRRLTFGCQLVYILPPTQEWLGAQFKSECSVIPGTTKRPGWVEDDWRKGQKADRNSVALVTSNNFLQMFTQTIFDKTHFLPVYRDWKCSETDIRCILAICTRTCLGIVSRCSWCLSC